MVMVCRVGVMVAGVGEAEYDMVWYTVWYGRYGMV